MKNNLTYKEAIKELRKLENYQRKFKKLRKTKISYARVAFQHDLSKNKREINILLSVIHAHKTSRKLYAQIYDLKMANRMFKGFSLD